jgi:hypothetical protein
LLWEVPRCVRAACHIKDHVVGRPVITSARVCCVSGQPSSFQADVTATIRAGDLTDTKTIRVTGNIG